MINEYDVDECDILHATAEIMVITKPMVIPKPMIYRLILVMMMMYANRYE